MREVIEHYDRLIDEGNDPVYDPQPLRDYMDKWDGQRFIDSMRLDKSRAVLEIGVGTGRLANRVAPSCKALCGIDISEKTAARAAENLAAYQNISIVCGDFLSFEFEERFDVIYSSLTFMHLKDKLSAVRKVGSLLKDNGLFVLSIDKNQSELIDMGDRKVKIYPDDPKRMREHILAAGLRLIDEFETEHAHITVSQSVRRRR